MSIQWSLVLFTVIAGIGAWLFACLGVAEVRGEVNKVRIPATITSVALLAVGGIASATHLSHVDRILDVLTHPTAGIFLEALLLGIVVVCALIYLVLVVRKSSPAAIKAFAVAGAIVGVIFTFACGYSYMMSSRPAWNSLTLPLAYMGTVAAGGCGLYLAMIASAKESAAAIKSAAVYTVVGGVLALATALIWGFASGAAGGEYAVIFWLACVLCGGVLPLACGCAALKKPQLALVAGVAALAGGFVGSSALRAVMWLIGTVIANYFGLSI